MRRLLDRQLSIRQMLHIAVVVGIPYLVIGVVWACTHHRHLADVHGLDKLFSLIGEVIAWPPLIISNIYLQ